MANGLADQTASLSLSGFDQSISIRSDHYGKAMKAAVLNTALKGVGRAESNAHAHLSLG